MNKEIGGEFYKYDTGKNELIDEDDASKVYTMSGRTSLDFIIKDILRFNCIKKAYLPSYCCESMITPFLYNGIDVVFYDVFLDYDNLLSMDIPDMDENQKHIVLCMDYFGFYQGFCDKIFSVASENSIVIEDRTHSYYNDNNGEADYQFASLRKWTRFAGMAVTHKKNGHFLKSDMDLNELFTSKRVMAADKKKKYLNNQGGSKSDFLNQFNLAEQILDNDYATYSPYVKDIEVYRQLDNSFIMLQRQENGKYLIDSLKQLEWITLIKQEINEETPLFVSIFTENHIRDKLKQFLIERNIYCPVHWPLTNHHKDLSSRAHWLYSQELSIVCDQRYSIEDMEYIVESIYKFNKDL